MGFSIPPWLRTSVCVSFFNSHLTVIALRSPSQALELLAPMPADMLHAIELSGMRRTAILVTDSAEGAFANQAALRYLDRTLPTDC